MGKFQVTLWASAAAIGAASLLPAGIAGAAGDTLQGAYNFSYTPSNGGTPLPRVWVIFDRGPDTARVVSSAVLNEGRAGGYEGDLNLVGGRWEMTADHTGGWVCDDGRKIAWRSSYTLDPASMTGSVSGSTAANCDGAPESTSGSFTLTKLP